MATATLEAVIEANPALRAALTPRMTRYIPVAPHPKQAAFLLLPQLEAFYGGAAGGGKSAALLMAALQYVDIPGYAALILRRTFADLAKPGALIPKAQEWLAGTDAAWSEQNKTWRFPSGAVLAFGYLEHEADIYQYQSAEYQSIGFDELTQFSESQYRYMFSRLRRLKTSNVPLRMRSASNPGNVGHDWVKQRFLVEGREHGRVFIPAKLADNPSLDSTEYVKSLAELDPITKAQLLNGDWTARMGGSKFKREWFIVVDEAPAGLSWLRYWDLAATEPKPGKDPDWTAGACVARKDGVWYIRDMRHVQARPQGVEALIRQTAELDGRGVLIRMEQEPGASGKSMIDHYARQVLVGFAFSGAPATGSKEVRANPISSAAEAGNVRLVRGPWINAFLDEAEAFPNGAHDDMIDAVSGAFSELTSAPAWRVL